MLFAQIIAAQQYYYVRAGAGGNGSSWSSAASALPATLQRGAIYYVADGTYSSYTFDDANSGSQWIQIRKATQQDHGPGAGWQSTYGDGQAVFPSLVFRTGYYIFDGNVRNEADWRDGDSYGFRIRVSPGVNQKGITVADSVNYGTATGNITIRNCYIGADTISNPGDRGIQSLWDTTDLTIQNCLLRNLAVPVILRRHKRLVWDHCWIGPNNTVESGQHVEAIADYETDTARIMYNVYYDIMNTGNIVTGNGWNPSLGSGCHDWEIAHNVFWYDPSNSNPAWGVGHGIVTSLHEQPSVNWHIHHNTAVNMQGWSAGVLLENPQNVTINDNLWYLLGKDPDGGNTNLSLPSGPGNTFWTGADPFVDWRNGNFQLKPGHILNTSGSDGAQVGALFTPAEPDIEAPTVPQNLQGQALSSNRIEISWQASTDNAGIAYYEIYRDNALISTTSELNFEDTGLQASQLYTYKVVAVDWSNNASAASSQLGVTTLSPDLTPPTPPGNFTATPLSSRSINLAWQTSTDNQTLMGYEIRRGGVLVATLGPDETSWLDNGLLPQTTYAYEIIATDDSNNRSTPAVAQATTPEGPALAEGAVAVYHMDEGDGLIVLDSSGNDNDGVAQFSTTNKWVPGKYGTSLDFNGTFEYVWVPDSPTLDLSDGMTILAWIYPTAPLSGWQHVVAKNRSSTTVSYYLAANSSANQFAAGFNIAGSWEYVFGGQQAPANQWTHIAATYDGLTLRVYLNGQQTAATVIGLNLDSSTGPLTIGGNNLNEYFQGRVDEVYIYNRSLSQGEIQAIMQSPAQAGISPVQEQWLLYQ